MYFSILTFILEYFLQITSSVLGNLLDVVQEVQAASVELQNLTCTSFRSTSGNLCCILFHFFVT